MSSHTAPVLSPSTTPKPPPAAAHWQALMQGIARLHPSASSSRTLVLLPFVQLLPTAKTQWLAQRSSGLMPRFETSSSWMASLPPMALAAHDYRQNIAQDSLQARDLLLQNQHLRSRSELLYQPLLDICAELAPLAASCPPSARPAWGQRWQTALPDLLPGGDFLDTERQLQAIAVAWLGLSDFASDALFSPAAGQQFEQIILVHGLRADPLSRSLAAYWQALGKSVHELPLAPPLHMPALPDAANPPQIYACADEAALLAHSAYAVLQNLGAGRQPVALIAQDRHATRQLRATLEAQGARIKDETGWKLSTTHAASLVWAVLDAALQPSSNAAQIAWLHSCLPKAHPGLTQLEKQLGKTHATLSQTASAAHILQLPDAAMALLDDIATLGKTLPSRQNLPLTEWQDRLLCCLALHGLQQRLQQDEAGAQILRLLEPAAPSSRSISLRQFSAWLRDVLEDAHFLSPSAPLQPDVVILPAAQLLGRSFAAVVWPGVDAQRLPLLPKDSRTLSHAQRSALDLPSAQANADMQQQIFLLAMQQPQLAIFWQKMDGEQALAPSPLLQVWQQAQGQPCAQLPDLPHKLLPRTPQLPPQAQAGALRLRHISASGYEALRRCPYQFFSQQLLGLRADEELEQDPEASDWGTLVHRSLKAFHELRQQQPQGDAAAQLASCAQREMEKLVQQYSANNATMLLPYRHSWPQLAAHYLSWLAQDEAGDWRFEQGEYQPRSSSLTLPAPESPLPLKGSIDRIDRNGAGHMRLLDYKTGSSSGLKEKIKTPLEDTQLPFYALLLGTEQPQLDSAMYLAVNDKESVQSLSQTQWQAAATALQAGMQQDFQRIYAGAHLLALGHEEKTCPYCPARGLCRKGQWTVDQT